MFLKFKTFQCIQFLDEIWRKVFCTSPDLNFCINYMGIKILQLLYMYL